jgi:hypothetical protein
MMAAIPKIAGQHLAYLAAASGHDNAKRARAEGCNRVHSFSVQGLGGGDYRLMITDDRP